MIAFLSWERARDAATVAGIILSTLSIGPLQKKRTLKCRQFGENERYYRLKNGIWTSKNSNEFFTDSFSLSWTSILTVVSPYNITKAHKSPPMARVENRVCCSWVLTDRCTHTHTKMRELTLPCVCAEDTNQSTSIPAIQCCTLRKLCGVEKLS